MKQLAQSGRATNLLNQINIKDRYKRTPLLAAIEGGNFDLVRTLLDNGADPKRETKAPDSCNGIMLAFRYGHTSIAEYLLDHDYFELENSDNLFNYTLLHQAAYGSVDCVKMLLAKGANVNASSAFQVTPLHSAVSAGNPSVVAELLTHGADANATDKFGRTPLYLACNSFNLQIVKLLVEEGKCDVNKTDTNNNSAFDIADRKNLREVCRYLLQHGAIPRSIKENASGLGTLRFFRPYIASNAGLPDTLPTARTKAGLCCVGTKLYLNGGIGLKTIQNRPDESLFNHPNLLTDFFVLDLKDRKMMAMVSGADLANLVEFCKDTSSKEDLLPPAMSRPNLLLKPDQVQLKVSGSNVPIIVTLPTPPRTPSLPTPLLLSREHRSERLKVSKDGLTVQAMPQGYKSGMKKLLGGQQFKQTPQHAMASYQSEPHFAACVRATAPFSRATTPFAYWEMHILEATEKIVTIGFTPDDFPLNRYHPGWCMDSYAYHNDDGSAFHVKAAIPDHGFQWGPRYTTGDIVGAGINFRTNEVFFTKNGKFLGVAYRGVSGDEFYPTISLGSVGAKIKVNLGRKPFKFAFQVPTLSWTKLGHTSFSPLALAPHPDGNGKFIQISYGEPSRQGLVSQRGNQWHSPTVCVIDTMHSPLTKDTIVTSKTKSSSDNKSNDPSDRTNASGEEKLAKSQDLSTQQQKSNNNRLSSSSSGAGRATSPAAKASDYELLSEHFVAAPFTKKLSSEERKREKEQQLLQQQQQQGQQNSTNVSSVSNDVSSTAPLSSSNAGTSETPPSSSQALSRTHNDSVMGLRDPSPVSVRSSSSSLTRGMAPAVQLSAQSQGASSPISAVRTTRALSISGFSSSGSSAASDAPKRRAQRLIHRVAGRPYEGSGSDASSASSVPSWMDDSHDDSLDASFDYSTVDHYDRYGTSQRPRALRTVQSEDSFDAGASSEDDEYDTRSSSGDEADEEFDARSDSKERKPKRSRVGPRSREIIHKLQNRNAPASHNPSEFFMPECDYQVHYTPNAIYLFAPADEEEVQLLRLNIVPNIPSSSSPSPASTALNTTATTSTHSNATSGSNSSQPSLTHAISMPLLTGPPSHHASSASSASHTTSQDSGSSNTQHLGSSPRSRATNPGITSLSAHPNFSAPLSLTASTSASGTLHGTPSYTFSWTDILSEHPSLRRELVRLTDPHTALIQGHLYIFSQTVLLKLDLQTLKFEVKQLNSIGPRGKNFSSTVICSESTPLVAGAAHILCFGGVAGNIAQSNVFTLDVVTGEWDVPHLSGVIPRPRVEPGGLAYVGEEQHIVVIQGGWNGKNYMDDLDFLHLEEPIAPDPLSRAINLAALSDFTIWSSAKNDKNAANSSASGGAGHGTPNKTLSAALAAKSISAPAFVAKDAQNESEKRKKEEEEKQKQSASQSTDEKIVKSENEEKKARKSLLVNRVILGLRSSFFKTLFELEPNRKEFVLDGKTDFALFSAFVKYLYTDDIEPDLIDDTNAAAFISLFSKYAPKHRERVAEELLITRPAIKSTMDSDLALALNSPLFSDVKFVVSYKDEIPVTMFAHRAILCTRNDVFGTMFTGASSTASNTSTSTSSSASAPLVNEANETVIKGIPAAAFLEVLRYIYTFDILPEAKEDHELVIEILQASHRYGVKGLQNLLTDIVSANFTTENVISLLCTSEQLGLKKLLKSATAFLRSNLDTLQNTPAYVSNQTIIQQAMDTFFPQ